MSNRLHQMILAVAIGGLAGGVVAQNAPDADPATQPHAMHGDGVHGNRGHWGEDGRDGDYHDYHHHHHHHWRHHHWHHHQHGRNQGLVRAFRDLNLSAAQRQQIHAIVASARQQFATQWASGAPDRVALMNPGDPNYATAVQTAKKRAADRVQRVSDLKLQLYNVLTPEQKSQLSKSMAEWKARIAQRAPATKDQPAPAAR